MLKDIGACIREIRIAEKINSVELSQMVGIDPTTLRRIETGKIKNPAYDTIFNIAELLSKTPTVAENKIDLTKYTESVSKIIMAFKDMPDIKEKYLTDVVTTRLDGFMENINYLSAEEMELINMISLNKRYFNEIQHATKQLKNIIDQFKRDHIIIESDEFDYAGIISLLLEVDMNFRERMNSNLRAVMADDKSKEMFVFLPMLLAYLGTKEAANHYKGLLDGSFDREKETNRQIEGLHKTEQLRNYID